MKKLTFIALLTLSLFAISGLTYAQTVLMNEIFSRGTVSDPDWIEVYNPTSAAIDISGYKIYDNGGQAGTKPKKEFPAATSIPAYGYFVIVTDDTAASGFGISTSGEWVWLENATGTVIDSFQIPALAAGQTAARTPDGGSLWKVVNTITRGKSNVVLTSLLLPQFIQGASTTNNNRTPYAFRVKIDNLAPNTTYRYINQVVTYADGATTSGAGNVIFVYSDSLVRTTGPTLANTGPFGLLTTDANGSHTGWYMTEPTGNARFTAGNYVSMRIRLNNGANGTVAVTWATTDSIKVIDYGTDATETKGTGIYGASGAQPKDFIFLYDNVDGDGRPLAGVMVENDGITLSTVTSIAQFYRDSVDGKNGYWGTIIPNMLSNGVRRIERRLFADGTIHPVVGTDADGVWPSGANTVNPLSGLTAIRLSFDDAPVPVELTSFTASTIDNSVILNWSTATETNNAGFEVERKIGNSEYSKIGYVEGKGTTTLESRYQFTDELSAVGNYTYRLKQVDFDGSYTYYNEIVVNVEGNLTPTQFSLGQNYPNPFNPTTKIDFTVPVQSNVVINVYDVNGSVVKTLVNEVKPVGSHQIQFDASQLSSGIYFYKMTAGGFVSSKKLILIK